jgi:hypothetical protein
VAIDFATEATLRGLSPGLAPLSTSAGQAALLSAITSANGGVYIRVDDKYFAKNEIIPSTPSHTYTLPIIGIGGYVKVDKPVVIQFNDVGNDMFALPANAELNLKEFEITSIILTSVLASTTISTFITGR